MSKEFELKECVVVGAGISGIALARWLKVCFNYSIYIEIQVLF